MPFFNKLKFKKINKKRSLIVASLLICCATALYVAITYVGAKQPFYAHINAVPENIKGNVVTLKQLKEENFIDFHNIFSSIVRKNLEFPEHITLSYTINYLKEEMQKARTGKMLWYGIFDNKENKLIGSIEIRDLNDTDPGQLGCWINEHYWGKGRFQEALDLISKAYFQLKPNEKQYIAHVRLWNKRSYYALKKYGFKETNYYYENNQPTRYILTLQREQI